MKLVDEVRRWDGKSAHDIAAVYQRHCSQSGFVGQILENLCAADTEQGMTWLLKAWLDSGAALTRKQQARVFQSLHELQHWQARLHVLQCLPHLTVAAADKSKLERFLRQALCDSNKFVRAWAYNGFYLLARQHPDYQAEADHFIDLALRDEAASVQARIRNMLKVANN